MQEQLGPTPNHRSLGDGFPAVAQVLPCTVRAASEASKRHMFTCLKQYWLRGPCHRNQPKPYNFWCSSWSPITVTLRDTN